MRERIAIVAGVRTPFSPAGTLFAGLPAVELGRLAVKELIARGGIDPATLGSVIIGAVSQPPEAANLARLIALQAGVPETVPAHTVQRHSASGLQALISGAQAIATGAAELVVAGGVESASSAPFAPSEKLTEVTHRYLRSRTTSERIAHLLELRPKDLLPQTVAAPLYGPDQGEAAELVARELAISRAAQDEYALSSHRRATAAQSAGRFKDEIMTVLLTPEYQEEVDADNGVRADESLERLGRLPAAHDPRFGTVTSGNSAQAGDGAAVLLLAGEKAVTRYGLTPLGYLGEHLFSGLAPSHSGLGAPLATAQLLARTGHQLSDFGLVEMHEACAAQIICAQRLWAEEELARRYLNLPPLGRVDGDRLNVNGGAIAIGDPAGASGARLVLSLLLEMRRRKVDLGLATLSIDGGQGAALIIERGRS